MAKPIRWFSVSHDEKAERVTLEMDLASVATVLRAVKNEMARDPYGDITGTLSEAYRDDLGHIKVVLEESGFEAREDDEEC